MKRRSERAAEAAERFSSIARHIRERPPTSDDRLLLVDMLVVADDELHALREAIAGLENELEYATQRCRRFFDSASDAFLTTDSNGTILDANGAASQLFGLSREFLSRKPLSVFLDDASCRNFERLLSRDAESPQPEHRVLSVYQRGGKAVRCEIALDGDGDSDARQLHWTFRAAPSAADDSMAAWVAELESLRVALTERLDQESAARVAAEHASASKSEFLATLSHELRTPLQALYGYSELLLDELHGPLNAQQRDHVSRMQQTHEHVLSLVNGILEYIKLDSGMPPDMTPSAFRLVDLLKTLHPLIEPQLIGKQIGLVVRYDDDGVTAFADPEKVHRIVVNLVANAIKFTPSGGSITIACNASETCVVSVADTGRGIPEDMRDAIFEPFVQADRDSASLGTGLGLAISRRLARAMGGALDVASESGNGATFTLTLPKAN